jgi:hypothetical protein
MFDDLSMPLRIVIALAAVLVLIGVTAWVVRRFGADRLGAGTARGRQPRLAVIDAATVDGRRRLILIRRDNVEHLMMIGGPTDVVVEANIVRAAGPAREAQPARPPAATDTLPRAVPLGEGTMWPLQPEPAPRPEPVLRPEPALRGEPIPRPEPLHRAEQVQRTPRPAPPPPVAEESAEWSAEAEAPPPPAPPPRRARQVDPLAGLAEELARTQQQPPAEPASEPPRAPMSEPRLARREPREPREPRAPRAQPAPAPAPVPAADAHFNSPADQNLAEMAQRLEAALRRPAKPDEGAPRTAPELAHDDTHEPAPPPPVRAPAPAEARPARGDGRTARAEPRPAPQQKSSLYDSLEQEMASLLGRPNSKP